MRDVKRDDESGESCLDPSQTFREKIKVKSCCQSKNNFYHGLSSVQLLEKNKWRKMVERKIGDSENKTSK